jgi:hypothetical protein
MAIIDKCIISDYKRFSTNIKKEISSKVVVDVDTSIKKVNHYIDGYTQIVTYYNQLVSSTDYVTQIDGHIPVLEQQYIRIKQLPIKLEKPIDVTTESELKGTAILPPEIKPYQGDVIRFNLLNGRDTLFSITEIEENTYNIDKVYKVNFSMLELDYYSESLFKILDQRVVRDYTYDLDSQFYTSSTIFLDKQYTFREKLKKRYSILDKLYLKLFRGDRDFIYVNHNGYNILDPYINKLYLKLTNDYKSIFSITIPSNRYTIIDILLNREIDTLPLIDNILYTPPSNSDFRLREFVGLNINYVASISGQVFRGNSYDGLLPEFTVSDNNYIFSNSFFNNKDLSVIEYLTLQYLNNEILNSEKLEELVDKVLTFEKFDIYVYLPVILLLINYYLNKDRGGIDDFTRANK